MDYKDFSADAVHFQLQCVPARLPALLASDTHAKLKLQTRLSIGACRAGTSIYLRSQTKPWTLALGTHIKPKLFWGVRRRGARP